MHAIRQLLTRLGGVAAHPGAFGILIVYALLWFIFDRDSLDWHAVTTLIVWFMTLLIQRAEHRDTQALQAKIDELLHAHAQADNSLTKIDEKEPEDIERHRNKARTTDFRPLRPEVLARASQQAWRQKKGRRPKLTPLLPANATLLGLTILTTPPPCPQGGDLAF
jgi:low affinity Fe/Cu permease